MTDHTTRESALTALDRLEHSANFEGCTHEDGDAEEVRRFIREAADALEFFQQLRLADPAKHHPLATPPLPSPPAPTTAAGELS